MKAERKLKVRYCYWLVVRNAHLRQCRFLLRTRQHDHTIARIAKAQLSLWCYSTEWLGSYRLLTCEITYHSYTVAHGTDERYNQGYPYNFMNDVCQLSNLQMCSKVLQIFKVEYKILPATFWMRRLSTSPALEMGLDILTGVCLDVRDICTGVNVINMYSSCKPLNNLCLHKHSSYLLNVSWKSNSLMIFPVMCRHNYKNMLEQGSNIVA